MGGQDHRLLIRAPKPANVWNAFHPNIAEHDVNVRWAPSVTDEMRLRLERQFGLLDGEVRPERIDLSVRFWCVASGNGRIIDHNGLLGVRVPAGSQELVLAYRPQRFGVALAITITALAVAAATGVRRRTRTDLRD